VVPAWYVRIHREFTQPRWRRLKSQFTSNLKISPLFVYIQFCLYLCLSSVATAERFEDSVLHSKNSIIRFPRHSFCQEVISTCRVSFLLINNSSRNKSFSNAFRNDRLLLRFYISPAWCGRKTSAAFSEWLTSVWLTSVWLTSVWLTSVWLTSVWLTSVWLTSVWLTSVFKFLRCSVDGDSTFCFGRFTGCLAVVVCINSYEKTCQSYHYTSYRIY